MKTLALLDIISTLKIRKIVQGKCNILKNTSVKFYKSSRIFVERGSLSINCKWTANDPFHTMLSLGKNARLIAKNYFHIYSGSRISITENATLVLGSGYINNNLNLSCFQRIEIGENVAISENVCIRDSDNHSILSSNHIKTKPIKIGNHVWIGMNVTILKDVTIGNGVIIAANSLVNKDIPEKTMAAGIPAKVIKKDVNWM